MLPVVDLVIEVQRESDDRAFVDSAPTTTGRGEPTVRVVRKQAPLDQRTLVLALASLRARESPAEPRSSETGIRRGTKTSNTAIDESNTTATNAIEPRNSSEDMSTSSGRETRCVETSTGLHYECGNTASMSRTAATTRVCSMVGTYDDAGRLDHLQPISAPAFLSVPRVESADRLSAQRRE
ncbi:hypothetical protein [Caballeronia glebae]|uniref:hypothetical protein n=1 Tax=Caballeronia glebae TaxID=1777143 RepID=UPI0038BA517A